MAKLVSKLNIIANKLDNEVAVAIHNTANFILTLIRLSSPVDTGALRDSYQLDVVSPLHILVGSSLNYSVFQEFGTSKMSAQSHVLPAFAQAETIFRNALIARLKNLS